MLFRSIEADDIIDNGIGFIKSENADINKSYQSNTIEIRGINTEVGITINKGKIVKNGIELAGQSSSVVKGDEISVKLNSPSSIGVTESMEVIIGGVTLTYSVTTGNNFSKGYAFIGNGKYSGEGISYYYLTMDRPGRLQFTDVGNRSNLTILDLGLNEVYGPISNTNRFLSAGSYIVKISNQSLGNYMTLYSPVLGGSEELVVLTDGNYRHEGAAYFRLDMSRTGNVDFSDTGNRSSLAVYGPDLKTIYPGAARGTHTLEIGSYIVRIYNQSTTSYMTVNVAQ